MDISKNELLIGLGNIMGILYREGIPCITGYFLVDLFIKPLVWLLMVFLFILMLFVILGSIMVVIITITFIFTNEIQTSFAEDKLFVDIIDYVIFLSLIPGLVVWGLLIDDLYGQSKKEYFKYKDKCDGK